MIDQIRSFIAVELPETVKSGLARVQEILKLVDPTCARWVAPSGIHLTLKFLGNVPAGKIDAIVRAMEEASGETGPLNLEIKGLGVFPNLRRPQVVWAGVTGDIDRLQNLQRNLDEKLGLIGFTPERRAFTPHLTLARVREDAAPLRREALGAAIGRTDLESDLVIEVKSISLMRSELTRSGAVYSRLALVHLKPSC